MTAALPYVLGGVYAALIPTNNGTKDAIRSDAEPQTLASRGSVLPYLIGRRRIGAIFGWVGARFAQYQSSGGSGKGGGSKKQATQITYAERGWHLLAVGPVKKLYKIWVGGKVVFNTTIDSAGSPSGSEFNLTDGSGTFRIYWGELTQPVDTQLAADTTIASRWPGVCYIYWRSKQLGSTPRWPLIEYEIETDADASGLTNSPSTITTTVANPTETITGINPVHALAQILFGPWPRGLGLSRAIFDASTLEALACTLKDDALPASFLAQDGKDAATLLGELFTDCGFLVGWKSDVGKFFIKAIRKETGTIPDLDASLVSEAIEIGTDLGERAADKTIWAFADKNNAYKTTTIVIADDGQASYLEYQSAKRVEINSVIHFASASKVAERRSQEAIAGGSQISITAKHSARILYPGAIFTCSGAGLTGNFRALEVQVTPNSSVVKVQAMLDFYGTTVANYKPAESPVSAPPPFDANADLQFDIFEVPDHLLTAREQVVIMPRVRADTQQQYADLWMSEDNTTYEDDGREFDRQTGGTLSANWATSTNEVAQGPTITLLGPDAANALDLSGDLAGWRAGKQMALVDDEIVFVKKLTALGGSSYRLDGVIRARFDTVQAAHSAGAKVYLVQLGKILELRSTILAPNKLIYAKSQPSGMNGSLSLGSVTARSRTLVGKGVVPMPVGALRTVDQFRSFRTGEDVSLEWCYRSAETPHTGAGMQGAGSAVGTSPIVGSFELKFYTLGSVLKATRSSATNSFTYTNAMLVADFGSEQSFIAEVRNINGGWKSAARSLTVTLV